MSKCQNKFNKSVRAAIVIHYLVHLSLIFILSPYLDNRTQKPNQFRTDYCQDCYFHEICLYSASFTSIGFGNRLKGESPVNNYLSNPHN